MKLKKIMLITISIAITINVIGCSKNKELGNETNISNEIVQASEQDKSYVTKFNELYTDKLESIKDCGIYFSVEKAADYFESNEYPGNEKYLENLKAAYEKTKENINGFITELESVGNVDNADLNKMSESLINEAKLLISNIETKIERVNQIPESILDKSSEDFIKLVDETSKLKNEVKSTFSEMVVYLEEQFNSK